MLGKKIKEMPEARGLLQKEVASVLQVDIAYVSKMEHGEKPLSRNHLKKLPKLFQVPVKELLTLWLADKVYDVVKGEKVAIKALHVAEDYVLKTKNKKRKS